MSHHHLFVDITTREKTNFVAAHRHKLPILRKLLTKSLGMFLSNMNYTLFLTKNLIVKLKRCSDIL